MFCLARYTGRTRVEALICKKLSPLWQRRLAKMEGREGFLLLIILRLIPGSFAFISIGDKVLDVTGSDLWQ